ncbi:MAG: hypothetical protein KGI50_02265 [Patescibacteria group bacterium]|nr:hypothetical protein [Patescibacteria group bacterium]MDE2437830.1 hypothetical protein [Patescibacteria group bacterium]
MIIGKALENNFLAERSVFCSGVVLNSYSTCHGVRKPAFGLCGGIQKSHFTPNVPAPPHFWEFSISLVSYFENRELRLLFPEVLMGDFLDMLEGQIPLEMLIRVCTFEKLIQDLVSRYLASQTSLIISRKDEDHLLFEIAIGDFYTGNLVIPYDENAREFFTPVS